jgi:hypothetical protein
MIKIDQNPATTTTGGSASWTFRTPNGHEMVGKTTESSTFFIFYVFIVVLIVRSDQR